MFRGFFFSFSRRCPVRHVPTAQDARNIQILCARSVPTFDCSASHFHTGCERVGNKKTTLWQKKDTVPKHGGCTTQAVSHSLMPSKRTFEVAKITCVFSLSPSLSFQHCRAVNEFPYLAAVITDFHKVSMKDKFTGKKKDWVFSELVKVGQTQMHTFKKKNPLNEIKQACQEVGAPGPKSTRRKEKLTN